MVDREEIPDSLVLDGVVATRGSFLLGPVELEVRRGERVWLVGPNGAGKSTLLAVVAGFLAPDSGSVSLGGRVLADERVSLPPRERGLAMVFQELGLWPHLTLRRQCLLVADDSSRLERLAEQLGIESKLDEKPGRVSGGEAQRAALLRALMARKPLLLLDEPFSHQHADGRERMDRLLKEEEERGHMILVAGHDSSEGEDCDHGRTPTRRVSLPPPGSPRG